MRAKDQFLGESGVFDGSFGNRVYSPANPAPPDALSRYRHIGTPGTTTGQAAERWYPASLATSAAALGTTSPGLNVLRALPFFTGRGGTIDRIGMQVTAGGSGGSQARLGIFTNTSDTNLYPNALLYDSGALVTTSAGLKTATPNLALTPDSLLWIVALYGSAAPTVRSVSLTNAWPILGLDNVFGTATGIGWEVAYTFAALPATFPTGAAITGTAATSPTAVAIRYSA